MSTDEPHEIPIVLVVEDEVLIREDVMDVLEQSGFDALRAANAEDALSVLAAHPDIRAVFTDIEMPGSSDGLNLARQVEAQRPDIAVLVTSGRSYPPPDDLPPCSRFLPKPYLPLNVVRILRDMISRAPRSWDHGFGHSGRSSAASAR